MHYVILVDNYSVTVANKFHQARMCERWLRQYARSRVESLIDVAWRDTQRTQQLEEIEHRTYLVGYDTNWSTCLQERSSES